MSYELIRIIFALIFSISAMVLLNRYLNLNPFFCLLIASIILGLMVGKPFMEILSAIQLGFGSLLQQIGFIVALGSCLGVVMEKTGSMEVISQKMIYFFGAGKSIMAMTIVGLFVGIPVFCDSGFIILSRLIPSIAAQASVNPAQLALALSTGLYTTHTLVPPTPGPLAAAANLGLTENLGEVILIGILGSIPVAIVSYLFSKRMGRTITLTASTVTAQPIVRNISPLKAFLPLVLPILLITIGTLPKTLSFDNTIGEVIYVTGHPIIALLIGLIFSFTLIKKNENAWPGWISEALKDAGIILLITGAGGAFGFVIKTSGVDGMLKEYISGSQSRGIIFLIAAYAIAAILKTAQGSTTSSMIISSSLLAPLAASAGFISTTQLTTLVLAIGGGAMTISHANDSYFWVISQFSGFSPRDALRSFTVITLVQGITALLTSILLFLIW